MASGSPFPRRERKEDQKMPKLVLDAGLRYAQVIKFKAGGSVRKVKKKVIFGKDIDPKEISTSLVERQNLTLRQDNNRISRKTIGFSKKLSELGKQMTLYFAHFNF
jgi:IS1 transposase.